MIIDYIHHHSLTNNFQFKQCDKNRYYQYEKYAAISYRVPKRVSRQTLSVL